MARVIRDAVVMARLEPLTRGGSASAQRLVR